MSFRRQLTLVDVYIFKIQCALFVYKTIDCLLEPTVGMCFVVGSWRFIWITQLCDWVEIFSHSAQCLITYWRLGNWLGAVQCPVCRQQVTILLRNFRTEEVPDSDATRSAIASITEYNRRFSGEPRPVSFNFNIDSPNMAGEVGQLLYSNL